MSDEGDRLQLLLEQQQGRPSIVNPDDIANILRLDMGFGKIPRPDADEFAERQANRILDRRMREDIIIDMDIAHVGQEGRRGFTTEDKIKMAVAGAGVVLAGGVQMSRVAYNNYVNRIKEETEKPKSRRDELLREFYSSLSAKAYDKDGSKKLPRGVEEVIFDNTEGFAKVFKKDNKVIIAYKGTDVSDKSDLRADLSILSGFRRLDPKFNRAVSL